MNGIDDFEECSHVKIGTISAGDHTTGPHASVRCCGYPPCIGAASRYVHARTGKPARELLTYVDARAGVTR